MITAIIAALAATSSTGGSILGNFDVPSYTIGVVTGGVIVLVSMMIRAAKNKRRMRSEAEQTYEHIGTHQRKMQEHLDGLQDETKKALAELEHLKNELTFPVDDNAPTKEETSN